MAIVQVGNQQKKVDDDSPIQLACDELGIIFGCRDGMCRTCESVVLEGMENLSPKNEKEEMHDLPQGHRLMCQAEILKGKVVVKQANM